jgi:hypothetical protein
MLNLDRNVLLRYTYNLLSNQDSCLESVIECTYPVHVLANYI